VGVVVVVETEGADVGKAVHVAEVPEQVNPDPQEVPAAEKTLVGHLAENPVQNSGTSQGPAEALQRVELFKRTNAQVAFNPLQ
jgi:hypothetical protein